MLCHAMPGYAKTNHDKRRQLRDEKGDDLAHVTVPRGLQRMRTGTAEGEWRPVTCHGASWFAEEENLLCGRRGKTRHM